MTLKSNRSQGLGDTLEKIFKVTGIAKIAKFVAKLRGREDCTGCQRRKKILNQLVKYKVEPNEEDYLFEKMKAFIFLEDAVVYINGIPIQYLKGETIYVHPGMNIFFNLKELLGTGKIQSKN